MSGTPNQASIERYRCRAAGYDASAERTMALRRRTIGSTRLWHCCEPAESVRLPEPPDAVLFNYVHDITRTPAAVENILRQCKPGARIAIAGMKFFPWWTGPLNLMRVAHARSGGRFARLVGARRERLAGALCTRLAGARCGRHLLLAA